MTLFSRNIWSYDGGATEIVSGLPPTENALFFDASAFENVNISGSQTLLNTLIGYVLASTGEFKFVTSSDILDEINVTNNAGVSVTYRPTVDMYIFGLWRKSGGFSDRDIAIVKNNLQPRHPRNTDVNVNFNQESSPGELAESGGRTVTINHASPTFTPLNELR